MKRVWENDDVLLGEDWCASGNHKARRVRDHSKIAAIVLVQDGNMGGSYVRVISFVQGEKETYFNTYRDDDVNEEFFFETPVRQMQIGDLVVNTASGIEYVVTRKPDEDFYRVLEPNH